VLQSRQASRSGALLDLPADITFCMNTWFEPLPLWAQVNALLAGPPREALLKLCGLALLGAAGVASAVWIGTAYFDTQWNAGLGFHSLDTLAFEPFRTTLAGFVLAPLALAALYLALAPLYRLPRRPLAALAVAVVGALPIYAAGLALVVLPGVLLLFAAFFLSCFWWSVGLRTVLGVPPGDASEFNVLALLGSGLLLQFGGALLVGLL
jgi:hypothetical protein